MTTTITRYFRPRIRVYTITSNSQNSSPPWSDSSYYGVSQNNSVTKGENYKNWKDLIRADLNATTSLTGLRWDYKTKSSYYYDKVSYPMGSQKWYIVYASSGDIFYPGLPLHPGYVALTAADNQAKMEFIKKCRSRQTELQGLVVLGELRETLHQIINPMKTLRRGLTNYLGTLSKRARKVRVRRRRRGSNASTQALVKKARKSILADTWLEYSYGWAPLVSDIADAYSALETDSSLRYRSMPVTAVGVQESATCEVGLTSIGADNIWYNQVNTTEALVIYRGKVNIQVDNPLLRSSQIYGFSFQDFVPSAWELIPYSFLVDYFSNLGDVISAWSYLSGNIRWKAKTTVQRVTYTRTGTYAKPFTTAGSQKRESLTSELGMSSTSASFIQRNIHEGALIPTLVFEVPVGPLKWLNMAALGIAHQALIPFF